jgi:ubiquinol-cytochrome c reductase iron-sulfur subunit
VRRWLIAAFVLLLGRGRRTRQLESGRTLPPHRAGLLAELATLALLGLVSMGGLAFCILYIWKPDTQLLGLALGGALAVLGVVFGLAANTLVPKEKRVEEHPPVEEPEEREQVVTLVHEAGTGITRKKLLVTASIGAAGALGSAMIIPAASLGPDLGSRLVTSRWRNGRLVVDERGRSIKPDDISVGAFVTAFPLGQPKLALGSPLILVRVRPEELELPSERADWAPQGVLAFSKICTHAGCAVSMFRYPLHEPTSARPALVCPCHYSTFDVPRGGAVVFGPAARDLPQLPLGLDARGRLVATGDFSDYVGPSYSGIEAK